MDMVLQESLRLYPPGFKYSGEVRAADSVGAIFTGGGAIEHPPLVAQQEGLGEYCKLPKSAFFLPSVDCMILYYLIVHLMCAYDQLMIEMLLISKTDTYQCMYGTYILLRCKLV